MKRILFVGDREHHLFRPAVDWLAGRFRLSCSSSLTAAGQACRAQAPDFILLAQSRPGQFADQDVERLHALAPLARLFALLGAWCEGETRTGHPWPGVPRIYWHQFIARFGQSTDPSGDPRWSLPRTSTEAERLFFSRRGQGVDRGLVVVRSEDHLTFDGLSEVLADAGFATVRVGGDGHYRGSGASLGLWDCAAGVRDDQRALRRFAAQLKPAPVLTIVGFPRRYDSEMARACGSAVLLGKPFLIDDLVRETLRMTGRRPTQHAALATA